MSMDELNFDRLAMWVQVHELSLTVCNAANARQIGDSVGRFLEADDPKAALHRHYLRVRVEVNVKEPLPTGFKWNNEQGHEKWATFKFERLSDFCYGCGRLSHTSQNCDEEIVLDDQNSVRPLFGHWMQETRPTRNRWHQIGGGGGQKQESSQRDPNRKTWKEVMNASR